MANNSICRLCLEHSEDLLEVFRDEEGVLKINDILTHYSIIELKPDDEISNKICSSCWSKVHDFHEFCMRVQKIQESISSIIYVDNKNDVNEVVLASVCDEDEEPEEGITLIEVKEEEVVETFEETTRQNAGVTETVTIKTIEIISGEGRPVRSKSARGRPRKYTSGEEAEAKKKENKTTEKQKTLTKRIRRKATNDEENNENLINSFFSLNCELCKEHYNCRKKLFEHYEESHKIRGFILCCGKKYFKTTKIAEHVLWHKNPELFRCTKCDLKKVFIDKKHLETHMLGHIDPNSNIFQCKYCEKSFVKKYRFDQHMLTHLSPEEKKYICEDCGKPYATEALLRVHIRVVHINSYAHMCEICAKVFKSRVFFEKHQLEHMGQALPRVQCQICNAWMKNEHTMRAHMRLHDDEGAVHECDLCGKTGPSRNAILKHKRYVHFSERKFKCTSCDKAFKRAVSLKEHMTVHTGEVLYNCTFCTKTFNSGANMFAHKKKVHYAEWKMEKELNTLSSK